MGEIQGTCAGGITNLVNSNNNNEISNCFNVGKITKEGEMFQNQGGIIGLFRSGIVNINNCYNIALFTKGHNTNKIGGIIGIIDNNGMATMNKCYYLKQDDTQTAIGDEEDNINQVTACDNISDITATILNNNISNIEHTDEWRNWKMGEEGYPVFE